MAALDGGVLICDASGTVLHHDAKAAQIWRTVGNAGGTGRSDGSAPVDSVLDVVDEELLAEVFEAVEEQRASGTDRPAVEFVTAARADQLMRITVRPVPDGTGDRYLVQCRPVRRWNEVEVKRQQVLQTLSEGMRDPLASVRAAIETMLQYPSMEGDVAQQFKKIIRDQSVALSEHLDDTLEAYARLYRSTWPLDEMTSHDLLALMRRELADTLEADVDAATAGENQPEPTLRLRIDPYMLRQAIAFLARRIVNATQSARLTLRLRSIRQFAVLDLGARGPTVTPERLRQWQAETLPLGDTIITMTLREIIEHHDGEIWARTDEEWSGVRVMLPTVE